MPAPNLIWGGCARKEERVSHAVQQASWGNQALLYLLFSLGSGVSLIIILQHTPALRSHVQGFLSPFFSDFKLEGHGIAGLTSGAQRCCSHRKDMWQVSSVAH